MSDEKFFDVNIKSYSNEFNFSVFRPASFDDCKDNSVMFLMKKYQHLLHSLEKVRNCLIFIDNEINVPNELNDKQSERKLKKAKHPVAWYTLALLKLS